MASMHIDPTVLPIPQNPRPGDVYRCTNPLRTIVLGRGQRIGSADFIPVFMDGIRHANVMSGDVPALVMSAGATPYGVMVEKQPSMTTDPDERGRRLAALGPHIRELRHQYGLSAGDLARALGCPPARLSMLELAQPDPVIDLEGTKESEGRAALSEILAEAVERYGADYLPVRPDASEPSGFRVVAWEAIYGMLATGPARAAMATIHRSLGEAAVKGTGLWEERSPAETEHIVDVLMEHMLGFVAERDPDGGPVDEEDRQATRALLMHIIGTPRMLDAMRRFLGDPLDGLFRVGDTIVYKDKLGTVVEVDAELEAMRVTFERGNDGIVPFVDAKLANEDVATETARASLAEHLTAAVMAGFQRHLDDGLTGHDEDLAREHLPGVLALALSSDEARRLIRLHG